MNGLVLVDKPAGCTSHDVVNKWRKLARTKRVGHLGTLDPMATGLLLLVCGNATRLANYFSGHTKTYQAEITLGLQTSTYDIEGEIVDRHIGLLPDSQSIVEALNHFRGSFLQTPPAVSAKKVGGVPSYKLARQHKQVELKPVEVTVHRLQLQNITPPTLEITVCCSTGTYIRSIAHDLGQLLGCGATLSRLRRTHIRDLSVKSAFSLDALHQLAQADRLQESVVPTGRMLPEIPSLSVDSLVEQQIRHGRQFRSSPFVVELGAPLVRAISHNGDLVAMGELVYPGVYHPKVVL